MAKDKKIEVVCAWCGKMKKVKPYTYKKNKRFFCNGSGNSECRRKWESVFLKGEDNGNGHKYSKVIVKCEQCGKSKKVQRKVYIKNKTKRFFCNAKVCQAEWMRKHNKPEESSLWKGGVKALDVPLYDTYAKQIDYIVDCRRSIVDEKYLEVRCSSCDKWHSPSLKYLRRLLSYFNMEGWDFHIYCSDECKNSCSVYGMRKYPKGFKTHDYRNEALDPDLNTLVLNRDSYQCQKCGACTELEVHHIEGVAQEPMLANDLDNCITVCHSCHKAIHSQPGCTYHDYQREACEPDSKGAVINQ